MRDERGFSIGRAAHDFSIDEWAIARLAEEWFAGWIDGDLDVLVGSLADEPVLLPQNQPAVVGRESIRRMYRALLDSVAIACEWEVMEVEASGDWGYFWSTYKLAATPRDAGAKIESEGKLLVIVKRRADGSWKIARLIDNSRR